MKIQSLAKAAGVILLLGLVSTPAQAQWHVDVASWNLLNFGDHKSGIVGGVRNNLLDRMASIISRYDIVFVQEVLNGGGSLTNALAQRALLANYNCQTISQPSGWAGRQERYGVCWNTTLPLTLQGQVDFVGQQATSLDGNQYNAVALWMRPPLRATFRYTKPDGTFFDFTVYDIHTKPAYAAGAGIQRPQGWRRRQLETVRCSPS
ncbi:endonuclease/exonuclease/phosphatase family protein [Cystobacter fuscus]